MKLLLSLMDAATKYNKTKTKIVRLQNYYKIPYMHGKDKVWKSSLLYYIQKHLLK